MHGRPAVVTPAPPPTPPRPELAELSGVSWSAASLLLYTPDQRPLTFEGDFHHRNVHFLLVFGFDV